MYEKDLKSVLYVKNIIGFIHVSVHICLWGFIKLKYDLWEKDLWLKKKKKGFSCFYLSVFQCFNSISYIYHVL